MEMMEQRRRDHQRRMQQEYRARMRERRIMILFMLGLGALYLIIFQPWK